MELSRVTNVDVDEKPVVIDNDCIVWQHIVFLPLNQFSCNGLPKGRRISTRVPSMNPIQEIVEFEWKVVLVQEP
jgi:hypothetical protein